MHAGRRYTGDVVSEYQVYVIEHPQGRYYIGISEDVSVRVVQHNDGISKWTKGKGPWTLVWTSEAKSFSDARKLENLLKKQKGGTGFFRLTGLTRRDEKALRWVVQRTHSGMTRYRKALICQEKKVGLNVAIRHFACAPIVLKTALCG